MSRNRLIGAAVFAAALVILGAMATRIFEFREVKVERSEGRAAVLDPWLALDRALSGTIEVRRYSSVADIDFGSAGLVVADGKKLAAYDDSEGSLAGWVKDGGRLVIAWQDLSDEGEPALTSFPELVPKKSSEVRGEANHRARGKYIGRVVDIEASDSLYFAGAGREGYVGLSDAQAIRVALVRKGKGWALAGARPLFLENRRLADPGNRAFAADLLGEGLTGAAWLPAPSRAEASAASEGLAAKKAFLPVAGTALLLCLVLLWFKAPRLGPALPESDADTQSMLARFKAEGRFLLDRGAGDEILRRIDRPPPPGSSARGRAVGKAIVRAVEGRILESADENKGRKK